MHVSANQNILKSIATNNYSGDNDKDDNSDSNDRNDRDDDHHHDDGNQTIPPNTLPSTTPPPSPQQSSSYLEVPLHLLNPQQRSFLLQDLKFSDPPSTISAAQK